MKKDASLSRSTAFFDVVNSGGAEGSISYLKIHNLWKGANTADIKDQLQDVTGGIRALIVDLSDLAGDGFFEAISVLSLLVGEGPIWESEKQTLRGIATSTLRLTPESFEWTAQYPGQETTTGTFERLPAVCAAIPCIVLINGNNGPAAEVIAHAMANLESAELWGQPTAGASVKTPLFGVSQGPMLRRVGSSSLVESTEDWMMADARRMPSCSPRRDIPAHVPPAVVIDVAHSVLFEILSHMDQAGPVR